MMWARIKPGVDAEGRPRRVPMPGRYGLPHGEALPVTGWRVPRDGFVERLLADQDAVLDEPAAPGPEITQGSAA